MSATQKLSRSLPPGLRRRLSALRRRFRAMPVKTEMQKQESLEDASLDARERELLRSRASNVGGLREVFFRPHGWDDHQAVFAFVRQVTVQ